MLEDGPSNTEADDALVPTRGEADLQDAAALSLDPSAEPEAPITTAAPDTMQSEGEMDVDVPTPAASTSRLPMADDEPPAATRDQLIARRQRGIDKIIKTHNEHVRELFHLDRFTSLVHYSPRAAKEDNSDVFQQVC